MESEMLMEMDALALLTALACVKRVTFVGALIPYVVVLVSTGGESRLNPYLTKSE